MRSTALLLMLLPTPLAAQSGWRPSSPERRPGPVTLAPGPGGGSWREERDVRDRIRAARDAGQISRADAKGLRREAAANTALGDRLSSNGMSLSERQELDARALALRDRLTATRTVKRP